MAELTRILLVGDHVLVREGNARLLSAQPDLKVVGQAYTIDDGINVPRRTPIDVVLLDINLGQRQPKSFLRLARAAGFAGKVLVVTAGVNKNEAARLLREGCGGIFLKHEPPPRLIEKIRSPATETEAPGRGGARGIRRQSCGASAAHLARTRRAPRCVRRPDQQRDRPPNWKSPNR